MKKGRIGVATSQREDDQQSTASERVFETVLRCLDEPLPVASSPKDGDESTKKTLKKSRHPLGSCHRKEKEQDPQAERRGGHAGGSC